MISKCQLIFLKQSTLLSITVLNNNKFFSHSIPNFLPQHGLLLPEPSLVRFQLSPRGRYGPHGAYQYALFLRRPYLVQPNVASGLPLHGRCRVHGAKLQSDGRRSNGGSPFTGWFPVRRHGNPASRAGCSSGRWDVSFVHEFAR